MVEVLPPAQKLEGTTPAANQPPLVDLSKLDGTTKTAQAKPDATQVATNDASLTSPMLAGVQIVDRTQVASAGPGAEVAAAPAAPASTQVAEVRTTKAAGDNCDKSDACSFTPTTDREKSKEWWDARAQRVGVAPEKDPNCFYTVKFGDDLSTIAQRQLQSEGKAVNSTSLKAEQDKIIKLNDTQYKTLDCNPHFLKAGWRLNLDDCCTKPEVAPQPAPAPAPEHVAPPRAEKVHCNDAPPVPVRVGDCDSSGRPIDAKNAEHLVQKPGFHIIDRETGCPYDVPPGGSIIYNNHGHSQMITVENRDGSIPDRSNILFGVDQHGNKVDLSDDQKQAYANYFDCAPGARSAPGAVYDNSGAVVDNRQPYADVQQPNWQQDTSGTPFYQSQGHDWYRDDQNRDYYVDQGRNWYEDNQNRPFYMDQGHCWYRDQQGRDYFNYSDNQIYRTEDPNRYYYENQGKQVFIDRSNNASIFNYNTVNNFYGSQHIAQPGHEGPPVVGQPVGLTPHALIGLPVGPHGQTHDRFSNQEQGVNAERARHDADIRLEAKEREDAEKARIAAEKAQQTAAPAQPAPHVIPHPAADNTPQKHVPTPAEIEQMKSPEERSKARAEYMNAQHTKTPQELEAARVQKENDRIAAEQKMKHDIAETQREERQRADEKRQAQIDAANRARQATPVPQPVRQEAPHQEAPAPIARPVAPLAAPPRPAAPAPVARPASAPPQNPHAPAPAQAGKVTMTP